MNLLYIFLYSLPSLLSLALFFSLLGRLITREKESHDNQFSSPLRSNTTRKDKAILYQTNVQNLEHYKTRQFQVAYYAIALFGALIALLQIEPFKNKGDECWIKYGFLLLALLVAECSLYRIIEIQYTNRHIRMSQSKLDLTRKAFYWKSNNEYSKLIKGYSKFWRDIGFTLLFIFTIFISWVIVVYVIFG